MNDIDPNKALEILLQKNGGITDADLQANKDQETVRRLAAIGGASEEPGIELFAEREDGGTQVLRPYGMSLKTVVVEGAKKIQAEQQVFNFTKVFHGVRPDDGAVGWVQVIENTFGFSPIAQSQMSMFGEIKPEKRSVLIGYREHDSADGQAKAGEAMYVSVPKGKMALSLLNAQFYLHATVEDDFGPTFAIQVEAPQSSEFAIKGLFKELERYQAQHSIYRGKVLDSVGRMVDGEIQDPKFRNIWRNPDIELFFAADVAIQLEESITTLVEDTANQRANGTKIGASVVLAGPPGTGKTEFIVKTAKAAVRTGRWTVIFATAGEDMTQVINFARSLKSTVLIAWEDFEGRVNLDDQKAVTRMLEALDGAGAKGEEVLNVLTTNHPDKINQETLRAKRIEDFIEIDLPDKQAMTGLINSLVPVEMRQGEFNYDRMWTLSEGFTLAWIAGGVTRATRSAVRRLSKEHPAYTPKEITASMSLTSSDIENGLLSMKAYHERHKNARKGVKDDLPTLDQAFNDMVKKAVTHELGGHYVDVPDHGKAAIKEVVNHS